MRVLVYCYQSLDLDQFEKDIDQTIGPGAGKRISAIFRFIERHPDDLAFVSEPFVPAAWRSYLEAGGCHRLGQGALNRFRMNTQVSKEKEPCCLQ